MIEPPRINLITGAQRFAHELKSSLRRVADVNVLDLEEGRQAGDPAYNAEVEEFGLDWLLPCLVLGSGTIDAYAQPFSETAQGNTPPVGAMAGVMPLDGVARDLATTLFQQVIRQGWHPQDTCPWFCDHPEGFDLIAYQLGGYTFVLAVSGVPGVDDQVKVSGRIFVDVRKLDPIAGRHV